MGSNKYNPFALSEVAEATSEIAKATEKLGSALFVMNERQPKGPCETYIEPVNNISEVACRDKNGPQAATIDTTAIEPVNNISELAGRDENGPQAATIDTTAGAMLSDLKAGTFNKKLVADSSQKPAVPSISPYTEEDDAVESSSRRLGS